VSTRRALPAFLLLAAAFTSLSTASEAYSIFTVPLPVGLTLTASHDLVPQSITDDGFFILFSLRDRSSGAVSWYTYRMLNGGAAAPVALPSTLSGYQHVQFTGIASSSGAAFGWAWNTGAGGAITQQVPILATTDPDTIAPFGDLQGRFICGDGAGPNLYGQVFGAPPDHLPSATGRAGFWIPTTGITHPGYPLNSTALKDLTAAAESESKRTWFDAYGSYTNGDYLAGSHTTVAGFAGFWRYLRPVGSAYTFEVVAAPASLGASYTASTTVSWANTGVLGSGEALYRLGKEDDSTVPMVSFLSVGSVATIIQPPGDTARNIMRAHDLAKYGDTIAAIGFAKQRTGNAATGTDSNQTAWIWHPGDAQATRLQALVPKPAIPRIGTNAAAISLGVDHHDGGQIVIDGWDPGTTTTNPADKRILVLSRIPTLTQACDTTTIQENPGTAASVSWTADATTTLYESLTVTYRLGGTATKGVDYAISPAGYATILAQTTDTVVVAGGGIVVSPLDNSVGGPDRTVTVTLDASASGHTRATAYQVAGPATTTITIVNDDIGPVTTLGRAGSGPVKGPTALTVAFDVPISGLIAGEITADTGSISAFAGSGMTFTATWTPPPATAGSATLRIAAGVANAVAGGLPNRAANDLVIPFDTRPPTAVISTSDQLPTPERFAQLMVTVSDGPVTGLAEGDFLVSGGGSITPGSLFIDPYGWMFQVRVDLVAETTTVQLKANAVQDQAGNTNTASNVLSITRYLDPLTVTVDQAAGQADPAVVEPVRFTAVFSETVEDFDLYDVVREGVEFPLFASTAVSNPSGDKRTYLIEIGNLGNAPGVLRLAIGSHVASHAGKPNASSTSTDRVVAWNPTAVAPGVGGASGGAASGGGSGSSCGLGSGLVALALLACAWCVLAVSGQRAMRRP
jgi:hypothetical protein